MLLCEPQQLGLGALDHLVKLRACIVLCAAGLPDASAPERRGSAKDSAQPDRATFSAGGG